MVSLNSAMENVHPAAQKSKIMFSNTCVFLVSALWGDFPLSVEYSEDNLAHTALHPLSRACKQRLTVFAAHNEESYTHGNLKGQVSSTIIQFIIVKDSLAVKSYAFAKVGKQVNLHFRKVVAVLGGCESRCE